MQIIKYRGFEINLGDPNDGEQFRHNRAAFAQVFLPGNYDQLLNKINVGDVVIDAGANIGMFTIKAARKVGASGSIIAVEPQQNNIGFLLENIRINNFNNIKIIEKALYPYDDQSIHFDGMGVAGHISYKNSGKLVSTISLRTLVLNHVKKNFWLKMDIEGGEESLFAENQDLIYLNKLSGMAYEIHSRNGFNLINNQLSKLGLKTGKVYLDNDFKKQILKGFLKHPALFIKLYRGHLFGVASRVLVKKNSTIEPDGDFEIGMQYAWRI